MNIEDTDLYCRMNGDSHPPSEDKSIKSLIYKFNHYGYSREDYAKIKHSVYQSDYNNTKAFTVIFMLFMLFFAALSIFHIVPGNYLFKYLSFFSLACILKLGTFIWDHKHGTYSLLATRGVFILLIGFGIAESVYDVNVVATAILPIFIITSTVCANTIFEYISIVTIGLMIFICSSSICKSPGITHGDIINGVTFYLVSIVMHYYYQKARLERFHTFHKLNMIKKELSINAAFDKLSGALNRGAFTDITNKIFEMPHEDIAVCLLDVDDFKHINDNYGHEKGDYAIEALGKAVSSILNCSKSPKDDALNYFLKPENNYFGRLGGDEFFIIIKDDTSEKRITEFAEKLKQEVHHIFIDSDFSLSFSMGIVIAHKDVHDFQTVYALADKALYESKNNGKNCYTILHS
ncbi:GGDEF domain-containing protein [Oribacterium sp. P6A1]|uniref:GGDEF domain-containing protein n=1 Tax=Oribacterium sp. P6A1 TaxID=1410612 RepID=UPI000567091C|nr:GGDEF domain-containing protein [Oribacterium sp. P6A1]